MRGVAGEGLLPPRIFHLLQGGVMGGGPRVVGETLHSSSGVSSRGGALWGIDGGWCSVPVADPCHPRMARATHG